jgi:uncharacterized cofD-like protein
MEHRFETGDGLKGHTMGNLMLTALKETIPGTADEKEYGAIEAMEEILRIHGKVYPVTLTDCHLVARLSDGTTVKGETNIDVPKHDPGLGIVGIALEPRAALFRKTRDAILDADTVVIGPGDLYTSIMPNLIVDGMADALRGAQRRGARIVYVVNTMTKHGETDGYAASGFVRAVQRAIDGSRIDAALVNTGEISRAQREAYAAEHAQPVIDDLGKARGLVVIAGDLVSRDAFARHSPASLARAIGSAVLALGRS